jgi:hypothetical protein
VTAPYTFTFDTPPAPELLAQWCFELLCSAAWTHLRMVVEHAEVRHGSKLDRDEARERTMIAFQATLDQIPDANPFRPALERFIQEFVLPTVDEEKRPPTLRVVP